MQLNKLEIKGFKSFGDKITINFNDGVTAIVGPNGCGKSNVVDAIRWVLGEQSTKMLRSEKMENIIFNGTKTRKPSNLAEVSLTFDNTKNILPTEFSQVTITRKLYRSGESEYRLNDVQCRLKDITDLFLDTGIGSDSYSIIELKMIDEIIANKEGSRRALFEEASGISKYKLRKKQTFNKLKDTETDLNRVEDLLFEIERNLKALENQAKKAERYYRLKEQYKILSIILASFRIVSFRDALEVLDAEEKQQTIFKTNVNIETDQLDADIQKNKLSNLTQEKNLSIQQKATNEFVSKIRAYESDKKIKNEQLKFLQDKETKLTEELEKDKNQLNHVLYNLKRLNEDKILEEQNLQIVTSNLNEIKEEVEELRIRQQSEKNLVDQYQKETSDLQNDLYKAEKDIEILNIQKDALEQESLRNMEDTASKEIQLSEFNKAIAEVENKLDTKKHGFSHLQNLENELQEQLKNTEELLAENKEELNSLSRKIDSRQNEYNLTKSMVDNLEGFPESIRFLKKNANWAKKAPLLSDILFCNEEYRIAIENFLEPLMNHYVVESYEDAIEAIQLLSNSSRGKANFFILNNFETISSEQPAIENAIPVLSVTESDKRYKNLIAHLLQHVYLIDDGKESDLNTTSIDKNIVLIGKSGKFNKSKYTLSGGSVGLFEGKRIGRAKNLENLNKKIKEFENQAKAVKNFIEENTIKLNSLKSSTKIQDINLLQIEINQLQNELISVKTKQEQYQSFIENSQNRKQDISIKLQNIGTELISKIPLISELNAQKHIVAEKLIAQQQAFTELSEMLTMRSSAFNAENIKFHQQQNKVNGIDKDLEYRESQQENLDTRVNANSSELEQTKATIKETLQHVDHNDEDLIAMYQQKEELEKALQEAEKEYYSSREKVNELETLLAELRKKKDNIEGITNQIKEKKSQLKIELSSLKERLSVEFDLDIEDLLDEEIPENEDEEEIKQKVEKIKKQLEDFGAINSTAMEAYKEMEERYTFIQNQKKDLADAKASLLQTIKEIDDTAKDKFMDAFTHVREDFMRVFRSLFNEEDSCDLILTTPENPLESDIDIIARPKGKRPLSINQLSGGEKTLTATALLFSLYLLKPAPFCIFDEVDAPLDDTNIDKFNKIIRKFSNESQFIVVSHNKRTIASTDIIYGVTMVEQGVSRVVAVDLREVA